MSLNDLILFGGAAALLVVIYLIYQGNTPSAKLAVRAKKLQERKVTPKKSKEDLLSLKRQQGKKQSALIEALMRPLPNITTLQNKLVRAGSRLSARQFLLRSVLFTFLNTALFLLMHKNPLVGFFLGIIFGFWFPLKVLSFRINRQQKKFLELFPNALDLIVRGLRSGLPVSESINLVSNEVPDPVGGTFKHLSDMMRLGVSLEQALLEISKKLENTEFNFFTTSIILQRETGGNLSEILNNLSEVIRKRFMMKMKIKAMTSEARASTLIVGCLPFLVSIAVAVMNPVYMAPLVNDYRGNIALAIAGGMLVFGLWVMNRMAKFEI